MRAVACADTKLSVVELPDPTPDKGQLVLGVLRCGICGSDLHAREHCDGLAEVMEELDYDEFMRTTSATVMGHEFVGEVRERGRGARREFREGAHVVVVPAGPPWPGRAPDRALAAGARRVRRAGAGRAVDVVRGPQRAVARRRRAHRADGGGAARGQHVRRSRSRDVAIVLGCGPVGLAVICWLKARGVRTDRRLRPVGRPTRPRDPLRRGRRGRPDRGVAVRRRRVQARDLGARTCSASPSARWTGSAGCPAGSTSSAPPTRWAPPRRRDRSSSSASASPG